MKPGWFGRLKWWQIVPVVVVAGLIVALSLDWFFASGSWAPVLRLDITP